MSTPSSFLNLNVGDLTKILQPEVAGAIQSTIGDLLTPGGPNVGDPQPAGTPPIPVAAASKQLTDAVKLIDNVLAALDFVLKLGFLLPPEYRSTFKSVADALRTIRGWLD